MITVKGRVVTFSGKDEKQLMELAKSLGKTPQEVLELAITEHMNRLEKVVTKKTNKRSK